jgi:predicted nucleotidyltransferase
MKKMSRLAREKAVDVAQRAAKRLADDLRIRVVYLFGSVADSQSQQPRDLDLAMLADPEISLDEQLRIRADLVLDSEVNIDLVSLNHASVVLAREVVDHGVCLFTRTPEDEVEFVTRARSRYWDFSPYLSAQWKAAGERTEARVRGPET